MILRNFQQQCPWTVTPRSGENLLCGNWNMVSTTCYLHTGLSYQQTGNISRYLLHLLQLRALEAGSLQMNFWRKFITLGMLPTHIVINCRHCWIWSCRSFQQSSPAFFGPACRRSKESGPGIPFLLEVLGLNLANRLCPKGSQDIKSIIYRGTRQRSNENHKWKEIFPLLIPLPLPPTWWSKRCRLHEFRAGASN